MTEYRACTITDEHQKFLKKNNINLSFFVQNAIDVAMFKHTTTLRPDQQEWLDGHHINLDMLVQTAIDMEMNGHE